MCLHQKARLWLCRDPSLYLVLQLLVHLDLFKHLH